MAYKKLEIIGLKVIHTFQPNKRLKKKNWVKT